MKQEVYITGLGLVSCLGEGAENVFDSMCAGMCGFRPIERFPVEEYPQKNAGVLPPDLEDALRDEFPDDDLAAAMVVHAAREAIQQAGGIARGETVGLVLGANFGPMEILEWSWREALDSGARPDRKAFVSAFEFPRRIARILGCRGPVTQISMSCASGAATVKVGLDWIRAGLLSRVVAVGYDVITEYCWTGLTNLRTITTDVVRPFDRRRSGTIFSEGAAAVVIEGGDEPVRGRPLAVLEGAATNNNAFHMTAPAREGDGSRRVMAAALRDAGRRPEEVDHICAHATGTTSNDPTEAAAFRNLFGAHLDRMTVGAHKSQLGHMMGAAGLAETVVTVLVLQRGVIPPTIHHEEPDPACRLDCVPGQAREKTVHRAVTNSAGIGGNNGSLVLRKV